MSNMSRDEFLFWKHIDLLSKNARASALGSQDVQHDDKRKRITGIIILQLVVTTIFAR